MSAAGVQGDGRGVGDEDDPSCCCGGRQRRWNGDCAGYRRRCVDCQRCVSWVGMEEYWFCCRSERESVQSA